MSGQKTARKMDTVQEVGWRRWKKELDTDVDSAMREKTRAGGRGTKAKKDTPAARSAR